MLNLKIYPILNADGSITLNIPEQVKIKLEDVDDVIDYIFNDVDRIIKIKPIWSFEDKVKMTVYVELLKELHKFKMTNVEQGLYLLYSSKLDLYKIGITKNIDNRLKQITNDINDEPIVLYFIESEAKYEKLLHNKFKHLNVRFKGQNGNIHREWFTKSDSIINEFKKLIDETKETTRKTS